MVNISWERIYDRINNEIKVGTKIPKTDGGTRKVTRKINNRIYVRTGVKTKAEKYTTMDMIKFAYDEISMGGSFNSSELKKNYKKEYNQGGCVFSMTGGILVLLDEATCIRNERKYEYIKKIRNSEEASINSGKKY